MGWNPAPLYRRYLRNSAYSIYGILCTLRTDAVQAAFWSIPKDMLRGYSAAVGLAAIGSIGMLVSFIGTYCSGLAISYTATGFSTVSSKYRSIPPAAR